MEYTEYTVLHSICIIVTGAGITVHTNPCERLSVRVAVARVALRQCLRLRRVRLSLPVTWSLRGATTSSTSTSCLPTPSRSGAAYSLSDDYGVLNYTHLYAWSRNGAGGG